MPVKQRKNIPARISVLKLYQILKQSALVTAFVQGSTSPIYCIVRDHGEQTLRYFTDAEFLNEDQISELRRKLKLKVTDGVPDEKFWRYLP